MQAVLDDEFETAKTFWFRQLGPEGAVITASPASVTLPASGGSSSVTITYVGYDAGGNWNIDTNEGDEYGWQSVDSMTDNGDGTWTAVISATANNTGANRDTYFQFEKNGFNCNVRVYQEG